MRKIKSCAPLLNYLNQKLSKKGPAMEIRDSGYQQMLEKLLICRNAPYRSEPERAETMLVVTTAVLIELLERLATVKMQ